MKSTGAPWLLQRQPAWVWAALAGLMALMFCLRIFPGWFYLVRPDGEFRLADPDGYYHFRQAIYSVEHFPRILRWDDFSHYPAVLRNDAAGLYDLGLAATARLIALFGVEPVRALWWVCLWFPPVCATAIMGFVYWLVCRQGNVAIGLAMALWYLLLPGLTLSHMTIGIPDHHVVEMLFGVLCIFLLQRLVEREREQPSAWWRPAWGAALPLALLQFTWIGGPLFLAIFGLATFGQLAADVLAGAGAQPLVRAGIRYWLAFLVLLGGAGVLGPDLIILPYLWKASLTGTAGVLVTLGMLGWMLETPRLPFRPGIRLVAGASLFVVLMGILREVSPEIRDYEWTGLGQKSLSVAENQAVTPRFYFGVTGLAGILGLLAPLAGIITGVWRRPGWWLGVLPSLFFIALWRRTHDYGYQGALHAILLTGYFFGALATHLFREDGPRRWLGHLALAACSVAVVLCQWPARWTAPWLLPGEWYQAESGMPSDGWLEATRWLKAETPAPPPLPANPIPGQPPRGRVGVLTDWCDGQFVNTLAGLPATSSRFPTANGLAPLFLQSEEAVRATLLGGSTIAASVRHVALSPRTIGDFFHTHRDTLGLKAADYFGRVTFVNGQGNNIGVPTLGPAYDAAFATRLVLHDGNGYAHFRLIFETRQQSFLRFLHYPSSRAILPRASFVLTEADRAAVKQNLFVGLWKEGDASAYLGHLVAAVKIFEQVEGAKVEGTAPPGSTVTVQIPLRMRTTGRAWQYTQSGRTDADGNFRMVVPYATGPAAGTDVETTSQAVLSLEGVPAGAGTSPETHRVALNIPESVVQNGDRVEWRGWLGQDPSTPARAGRPGGLQ